MSQIQKTLNELGFTLIRRGKHDIYQHENGKKLTAAQSGGSYNRQQENLMAEARRIAGVKNTKKKSTRIKKWAPSDERQLRDFAEDLGFNLTHEQAKIWLRRYDKEARANLVRLAELCRL